MGRIIQTFVKRVGDELLERSPDNYSVDFDKNKLALNEIIENGSLKCPSKRIRNRLAGYISRAVVLRSK
ncbi:MAG: 30S ribosomal protein S17e [archaeon]|jgi:ribosomal protein S17E|nr:30S ribosomal protein S17e [Euryarchaeota archaeon]MDP6704572.1 30S ribosomal protein S17e [archaeon]HIK01018.1 30S ribosomal protein S17e [Candidatus Undinarchaeales archaeon ERR594346 U_76725]|tara:strand:- start:72034 stop:72240 length:207 start_codon:yes stop_codon:yes gene_type:complete